MKYLQFLFLFMCFPILTFGQTEQKVNPYEDLRNKAFSVKPSDLSLNLPINQTLVYGVIVDWSSGKNVATIVTFITGDASVYLRSGQIYIGGFAHKTISEPSKKIIQLAQSLISQTSITIGHDYPRPNDVKIYFLTNNGTYVHQDTYESIKKENDKWTELFSFGNAIITEYRKLSEQK